MNILPAWKKGITGKNVVVTILDDGKSSVFYIYSLLQETVEKFLDILVRFFRLTLLREQTSEKTEAIE